MTNQPSGQHAARSGGDRSAGARGTWGARLAALVGATLAAVLAASIAEAAEIVEVRVGRHPDFTRVVFELDRPAGYRIERASPSSNVSELVVSLEASSIPRRIQAPKKSLIEQVDVEPAGARSVARVRLTESGLKLKEMILASPPRIVLDVLPDAPAPETAASSQAPRSASSAGEKKSDGSEAREREQAEAQARRERAAAQAEARAKAEAEEAAKAERQARAERRAEAAAKREAEAQRQAEADRAAEAREAERRAEVQAAREATADEGAEDGDGAMGLLAAREQELGDAAREPSTSTPIERPGSDAAARAKRAADGEDASGRAAREAREEKKSAAAKASAEKRTPKPMVAREPDSGGGWTTWAMLAAGGVVLLLAGLFVARRRRVAEAVDFDEDEDGAEHDDAPVRFGEPTGETAKDAGDANPFADFAGADEPTLAPPGERTVPPSLDEDDEQTVVSAPQEQGSGSGAFAFGETGEGEEKDMDGMDVVSRDAAGEGFGGMPAMGGLPEEFQQMMREMNRRVEALETRIDELVDARDRLERQVAAQTEELRVQRAAIARTQRAVRNLARPEDEPEATEPALREPNPPGGEG